MGCGASSREEDEEKKRREDEDMERVDYSPKHTERESTHHSTTNGIHSPRQFRLASPPTNSSHRKGEVPFSNRTEDCMSPTHSLFSPVNADIDLTPEELELRRQHMEEPADFKLPGGEDDISVDNGKTAKEPDEVNWWQNETFVLGNNMFIPAALQKAERERQGGSGKTEAEEELFGPSKYPSFLSGKAHTRVQQWADEMISCLFPNVKLHPETPRSSTSSRSSSAVSPVERLPVAKDQHSGGQQQQGEGEAVPNGVGPDTVSRKHDQAIIQALLSSPTFKSKKKEGRQEAYHTDFFAPEEGE